MDSSYYIGVGTFADPYTHLDQITSEMKVWSRDSKGAFIIVGHLEGAHQEKRVQASLTRQGERMDTWYKGTQGKPFVLHFRWNLLGSPHSIHLWDQTLHFHCNAVITTIHLQRLAPTTAVKGLP